MRVERGFEIRRMALPLSNSRSQSDDVSSRLSDTFLSAPAIALRLIDARSSGDNSRIRVDTQTSCDLTRRRNLNFQSELHHRICSGFKPQFDASNSARRSQDSSRALNG